ncbi:unnamed protein product [Caenorhabditis bovis]|uniref:Piwi domain-containing protein n=1 Tax=Caenorhabditis bovis TaxID=2654633 RepID=A0A8S1F6J5_9PELO|nr:unnamed protein product [Caenorhabditis bovis]
MHSSPSTLPFYSPLSIKEPSSNLQIKPFTRVSHGTAGRPISLSSNHFRIIVGKRKIYEYRIKISPDLFSKKLNRRVVRLLEGKLASVEPWHLVFDGIDTIYAAQRICEEVVNNIKIATDGLISTRDAITHFDLKLQFIDEFMLESNLDAISDPEQKERMIHALDTILRQFSCDEFNVVLQSFFSTSCQSSALSQRSHSLGWAAVNLGLGREVCYGFYQSVVESFDILSLNLDVATTTFYRPVHVLEFLADALDVPLATIQDGRPLSEMQRKKFSKEIVGLKIETHHCSSSRRYRVIRCTWKPAANILLKLNGEENKQISVKEYYKSRYGIQLQHLHLPCLELGKTKECIIPLELCYIVPGQRCIKKLNEHQIANLIKATSRNAQERMDAVMRIREGVGISDDVYSTNYGIHAERSMMKIEGRVLPAPKIVYCSPNVDGQECVTVPNNGTWDMRGKHFYNGIEIEIWAVVCFASSTTVTQQNLRSFVQGLGKVAREIGMPFVNNAVFCKYATADQATKILDFLQNDYPDMQLVICVLPGKTNIYGEVKRRADMIGLTTQCVRSHNVLKISPHTLSNLCMKINSKLGGINLVLAPPTFSRNDEPVLYVGCHIYRNATSSDNQNCSENSIVCMLGSCDGHPTRFVPTFRMQPKNTSIVLEMESMMKTIILNFHKSTGFKPHRIIIYRSGVCKLNMNEILQFELRAIRNACLSIEVGFEPGITIIGLDNSHHTRLFANDEMNRMGNSMNVPAGTIVESGITVNNLFEFFLVSHAGIQGTSCPTRYQILWDDNKMSADQIQEMTYQLCHAQSRCTRSVSIPSPVYYARSAAQRAKIWMSDDKFDYTVYEKIAEQCNGMLFT